MGSRAPGSSPRVRGKLPRRAGQRTQVGLIPARAGKTRSAHRHASGRRAHPRACGENQGRGRVRPHPMGLIPARAGKTSGPAPLSSLLPAHPRACGENTGLSQAAARSPGSSPRVRGKPRWRPDLRAPPRLIPARAGKTSPGPRRCAVRGAHPRACGENSRAPIESFFNWGSSPRVRGKPRPGALLVVGAGLIPARAGKTSSSWPACYQASAHPRACGENALPWSCSEPPLGSSPRVRGKPCAGAGRVHLPRLIPARAGKTWSGVSQEMRRSAHPRACGENPADLGGEPGDGGSSPRVRGKQSACSRSEARRRLIPARAGKTSTQDVSTRPWRLIPARAGKTKPRSRIAWLNSAHPRACGENRRRAWESMDSWGSSPRVRGKLWSVRRAGGEPRLIPARAGKTMLRRKSPVYIAAHPRACGENPRARHLPGDCYGSSPRVRGKQQWVGRDEGVAVAHPRACGENGWHRHRIRPNPGSSPRVRGKRPRDPHPQSKGRLIPARAGKTLDVGHWSVSLSAHPRACGENVSTVEEAISVLGSSPRVRGKPDRWVRESLATRLIPARAGKTSPGRTCQ